MKWPNESSRISFDTKTFIRFVVSIQLCLVECVRFVCLSACVHGFCSTQFEPTSSVVGMLFAFGRFKKGEANAQTFAVQKDSAFD